MTVKKHFIFPEKLKKIRQTSGLSQKAIALEAGINQSKLCALERGRKPTPGEGLILRIAEAMKCDANSRQELLHAAMHDRIIAQVLKEHEALPALNAMSACLLGAAALSEEEFAGIAEDITMTYLAKIRVLNLTKRNQQTNK